MGESMKHRLLIGLLLGLVLGWLTAGSLVLAGVSRSTQDVMNMVLDDIYKGFRPAPSRHKFVTLHSAATSAGASTAADVIGWSRKTVQLNLTAGTATVVVETRVPSGPFKAITGCNLTAVGDRCSIVGQPAYELRTNITACSSCTVTTLLMLEP